METVMLLAKCQSKQTYGMKAQKLSDGDWWRTDAFPINEHGVASGGRAESTTVQGSLYNTEDYPGCPYCGALAFVLCNNCRKMSCYNGEKDLVCPWCGDEMKNIRTVETVDVEGSAQSEPSKGLNLQNPSRQIKL